MDGRLRAWSAETVSVGRVEVGGGVGGRVRRVWSVCVSGTRVVAGCDDGTMCAWELETMAPAGGPKSAGVGAVRALVTEGCDGRVVGCVGPDVVVWE